MEKTKTGRGFDLIRFQDLCGETCNIQKSSLADEDAIWIGVEDANPRIMAKEVREDLTGWVKYPVPESVLMSTRMHINRERAKEIISILQKFVDTGDL